MKVLKQNKLNCFYGMETIEKYLNEEKQEKEELKEKLVKSYKN